MSTVHNRLKAIERQLARRGAERILLDDEIDTLDDVAAEMALRGESDRLGQLSRLEAEQNLMTTRRGTVERQSRLF